jgi:O-antigen/teichoic acid export membrane protein
MTSTDQNTVRRRLTVNTISNVGRFAILMVITFFITPFIVGTLGDAAYGFWIVLMSFLGYASILEMGVQPAVVKLVGQYRAVEQYDRAREMITAALVFFLAMSLIVVVLCLTALPVLVARYIDDVNRVNYSTTLYLLIAGDATLMYLNYLLTGILYGCQRYHARNLIEIGAWSVNVAVIVIFLEKGGLVAMMAAKVSMDSLILLLSLVVIPRVFPELTVSLRSLRRSSFRDLMNFGGRVFISATTTRLAVNAQPMIISTVISAAATAFYAIPLRLVDYARQISYTLTASFMPMFSELESREDHETMRSVYMDYSRYLFTIMLPLPALLYVYGPDFLGVWIGPEYAEKGRITLYLLTSCVLIESFQPLMWRFFLGVGSLNILVAASAIVSALTIGGSILLARVFGIEGVALSMFIGAVVAQSMYLLHAARYLGTPWYTLLARVNLRPLVAGVVTFGVAKLLVTTIGASDYPRIFGGGLIAILVHGILATRVAITARERDTLFTRISGFLPGR